MGNGSGPVEKGNGGGGGDWAKCIGVVQEKAARAYQSLLNACHVCVCKLGLYKPVPSIETIYTINLVWGHYFQEC